MIEGVYVNAGVVRWPNQLSIPSHKYSCQPKEGGIEGTDSSCPILVYSLTMI